jgi:hypothetical protein
MITYFKIGVKVIGYKLPPSLCLIGNSVITVNLIPVEWMINVAGVSKHRLRLIVALHYTNPSSACILLGSIPSTRVLKPNR